MKPADYQRGLALGALLARLDALGREVRDGRARERVLVERVDSLSGSLAKAWRRIEVLDRPGARLAMPVLPQPASPAHIQRVSVSEAARRLDVDGETVRRWIESGVLEGEAQAIPGRRYRRWAVFKRSLDAAANAESAAFTGVRAG